MCVTVCGKFVPDKVVIASYDNRIRDKFPAKWGVQIAGMIFFARSSQKRIFRAFFPLKILFLLAIIQLIILSFLCNQLLMGTSLYDTALLQNHDAVTISYSR